MKRFGWLTTSLLWALAAGLTFVAGMNLVGRAAAPVDRAREGHEVELARQLAAGVQAAFGDADATLRSLAHGLEPWVGSPAQANEASRTLTAALSGDRVVDRGAVVADASGRVLGGTPDHAALFAHPRPYLAVGQPAGPMVSDVVVESLEQLQTVVVTVPLHGPDGSVRGVLAGYSAVPQGFISSRISELTAGSGGTVVVSPGGVVFRGATTPGPVERAGDDLASPAAEAASGARLLRYRGEGGSERAAAVAPLPNGWSAVRPVDPRALVAARQGALGTAAPLLGGVLLVAWIFAVVSDARRRRVSARSHDHAKSFLAVAGHELRTPLTMVRGFSETLTRRWPAMNESAQQEALSTLARQSQTLEHILTRVLLASQVDAGVVPEVAGPPVDAAGLVAGVVRHFEDISPLHEFHLDAAEGLEVAIDTKILEHVLANIIENAVKFSPAGGRVDFGVSAGRRTVQVSVEDEGIGVPARTAELFRRFGQTEAVATRTYEEGGLGLGLFIVKSLVELAGGRVHAEPRRPKGSRFVLELPRCRAKKQGTRLPSRARRARTKEPVASR